MGKCVVHPIGVSTDQLQELDRLAAGSVVIGGERYEPCVETELYTEFSITFGGSTPYPEVVDQRKFQGMSICNCAMTPDRSKLVFLVGSNGGDGSIVVLNLSTMDWHERAATELYYGASRFFYLDNECLLAANQRAETLIDFRFDDSGIRLNHQISGGLVSGAPFFNQLVGVQRTRFAAEIISPHRNREAVAVWTTGSSSLVRYSYDKTNHTLVKDTSAQIYEGMYWDLNSRFVDADTVLIALRFNMTSGSPTTYTLGGKLLLYHPSNMEVVTGIDYGTYRASSAGICLNNIVETKERHFAVDGYFESGLGAPVIIEFRVGSDTVEMVRKLEGSRLNEAVVYQDGRRVWRSGTAYFTVDDFATYKTNRAKIAGRQITPKNTGELTVGSALDAIPTQINPALLFTSFGEYGNGILVAKSKKIVTTLQKIF